LVELTTHFTVLNLFAAKAAPTGISQQAGISEALQAMPWKKNKHITEELILNKVLYVWQ